MNFLFIKESSKLNCGFHKNIKGIVHPKMKMWCLSAYPRGIQDVGDFVSSVEHKQRFLTQSVSHIMAVNGTHGFERQKKTYTDKTKLNPAARDDTLRSLDTKQSVCARNWTVFILFFTSDPLQCLTVLSAFTTAGVWCVNVLWHSRRMRGSNLSRVYVTHCLDRFRACGGSEVKNAINTVQFLAQTDCLVSKDLNVSSRAAGFNLVLSVYGFFLLSKPWVPLTAIIWLTDCNGLS